MSKYFFWALLLLVLLFAFRRGRLDERWAAGICFAATLLSMAVNSPQNMKYENVEYGVLAVDVLVLAAFVTLALRSARFWPLWIAGLQLSTLLAHFFKAVDFELIPEVYAAAERFWSYPILIIILIAAWRSQRRYDEIERFEQLHPAS